MEKGNNPASCYGVPPPPYTIDHTQAPPVYMTNPPYNAAPHPSEFSSIPAPQGYVNVPQAPVVQVVQFSNLRSETTRLICPHCRADVSTRVNYTTGRFTHIAAVLLCLLFCWPCAVVPYCTDQCMDAEHFCPNCKQFIGIYRR